MSKSIINWALGADRVLVLTVDDATQTANTMSEDFSRDLQETVGRLEAEVDTFDGVIITSGKDSFFAGGDLNLLLRAGKDDVSSISEGLDAYKSAFRRIETLGRPVVAAINGTALGGGFEIALAAHHRIALDKKGSLIGLPEVTFGLLPGAGGVTRTVRMLGVVNAVLNVVGQGQRYRPTDAQAKGLVDEVASSADEMMAMARIWIRENPDAKQPWDTHGYRIPGGAPSAAGLAGMLPAFPANVRKQLKGAPMPAPIAVLSAAVEGAQVDIETAFQIETRYCAHLICGQVSSNLIKTMFFDLGEINKGRSRPEGFPVTKANRVLVLGAGMMGAGIAYVAARSGAEVVLKDVTWEAADRGKDYTRRLLDKQVNRAKLTEEARDDILARITPSAEASDAKGCDLVIEAVFEDPELKKAVFGEIQEYVDANALFGSNTSTLPITDLAEGVGRRENFIGLHFFSPVDKMPLLEIVVGDETTDETLARAIDFALQIKKVPIVVNDSFGFFTTRVIGMFIDEALSLVAEGVHPSTAEQAAVQAGFPVGALALNDELNMALAQKIRKGFVAAAESAGKDFVGSNAYPLVDAMVDVFKRPGRVAGAGFYEYAEDGTRLGLWPGLVERYTRDDHNIPFVDMQERMLFAMSLDTARCFEEGVITSVPDANVGSIMGIGFPAWAGGAVQYMNQYDGGLAGFVSRADELEARYGARFSTPGTLRAMAAAGDVFS